MTLDVANAILQRRATKVFDAEHHIPKQDLESIPGRGCEDLSLSPP